MLTIILCISLMLELGFIGRLIFGPKLYYGYNIKNKYYWVVIEDYDPPKPVVRVVHRELKIAIANAKEEYRQYRAKEKLEKSRLRLFF